MPQWVESGYKEYAQRLTGNVQLLLKEIPAEKRTKNSNLKKIFEKESQKLLDAIPQGTHVVALDVTGASWHTEKLATQMETWMMSGKDVVMLVGGPEGMTPECLRRADQIWSLSALTFPHPLVRVIMAEQLYRAWSITENHPYHRAG
ncbi:MAG: LSU m3Psi1915 methyltransferase RlmH [uncultured Thiotrichaceae bacterium]|uniref:Ribosomal RNA large subunit methyltransferase H n=1 Tax=uncultured Thiotrichaceae bacterium TaxID=298394 RepID=A0A6S6S2F6_9GAMM|nr:MAG: LSU m3Psi1915 methyltransferase RlmH [uncultured Thiotrichaceae bacterium]